MSPRLLVVALLGFATACTTPPPSHRFQIHITHDGRTADCATIGAATAKVSLFRPPANPDEPYADLEYVQSETVACDDGELVIDTPDEGRYDVYVELHRHACTGDHCDDGMIASVREQRIAFDQTAALTDVIIDTAPVTVAWTWAPPREWPRNLPFLSCTQPGDHQVVIDGTYHKDIACGPGHDTIIVPTGAHWLAFQQAPLTISGNVAFAVGPHGADAGSVELSVYR